MNIADMEKLREKVKVDIIELKVAQDTAYWDSRDKLNQLENNYERLQQNMVELQMQHKAISDQYEDELRLRSETLNKFNSTHEICIVLEDHCKRLEASLSRCKNDQAMLAEAFNKSGKIEEEIKEKRSQSKIKNLQLSNNLQEQIQHLVEQKEQMVEVFNTSKQHLDSELNNVLTLATTLSEKCELSVAFDDLSRKLDHTKRDLEEKNDYIVCLKTDMKKCLHECEKQLAKMKNANSLQEKELKECTTLNEILKTALHNQEQFTQSIVEQNNKMQEKISGLEEEHILNSEKVKGLASRLEDSNSQCRKQEKENEELSQKAEELKNEIDEKKMIIEQSLVEQQNLKGQLFALEEQNAETISELNKATQELELRFVKIEEMSLLIQDLKAKISEMEIILENNKFDNANKINEKNSVLDIKIEEKDMELDCRASIINQLMLNLKNATDARTKLENSLEKMKKVMENDSNISKQKEIAFTKKVEQLKMAAKEQQSKLSQQMSIILETNKEKHQLQERLKGMQNIIDNIGKNVTGRSAPAAGSPRAITEQDNAVKRKPTSMNKRDGALRPRKMRRVSCCVVPQEPSQRLAKEPVDTVVYNFLSDSDTDVPLPLAQSKESKTKHTFKNKRSDNKAKQQKNIE